MVKGIVAIFAGALENLGRFPFGGLESLRWGGLPCFDRPKRWLGGDGRRPSMFAWFQRVGGPFLASVDSGAETGQGNQGTLDWCKPSHISVIGVC